MAKDKYMPHAFMDRGDRLGYSNGIISLAIGAIILILIFHGQTNMLIPLYAVGVFVPFTLSQSGMIIHWFREREGFWLGKAFINLVGALISFVLVICLFWQHFCKCLAILNYHAAAFMDVPFDSPALCKSSSSVAGC